MNVVYDTILSVSQRTSLQRYVLYLDSQNSISIIFSNIRDYASTNELICLSNMENINATTAGSGTSVLLHGVGCKNVILRKSITSCT